MKLYSTFKDSWGVLYSPNDARVMLYLTDRKETFWVKNRDNLTNTQSARLLSWTKFMVCEQIIIIRKYGNLNNGEDMQIKIEPQLKEGVFVDGKLIKDSHVVENGRCSIFVEKIPLHLVFEALCDVSEQEALNNIGKNYRYINKLGKGYFGEVYKAISLSKRELCAIKIEVRHDRQKFLLRAEYEMLKELDHANIIKCLDFIETENQQYLVLELADGGTLRHRIIHGYAMDEPIAKSIFRQVFAGVEYIHDQGVMHRDLKPDNIVLMSSDNYSVAKIIDFGISCLGGVITEKRGVFGAHRFLAPELLSKYLIPSNVADKRVYYSNKIDIWALGICLFATLTKTMPFAYSQDRAVYRERIRRGDVHTESVGYRMLSDEVKTLIFSCLTFDDEERSSAEEVLQLPWFADDPDGQYDAVSDDLDDETDDSKRRYTTGESSQSKALRDVVNESKETKIKKRKA